VFEEEAPFISAVEIAAVGTVRHRRRNRRTGAVMSMQLQREVK
jgi:hypothetical protein